MSDTRRYNRRTIVRAIGGSTLAVSLAGCSGSEPTEDTDDEQTEDVGDDEQTEDAGDDEQTEDAGDDEQTEDAGDDEGASVPEAVDSFLTDNNAGGYDGEIVDATGQDSVTIDVGAGDIGLQFAPVAVRVDAGTTITWEWTGEGGKHNVIPAADSDFDVSPEAELIQEAGHTADASFDEAGNFLYVCEPHQGNGKVGAVVVE